MTWEERLLRAKAALAYREAHWEIWTARSQRELAAAVHRAERQILTALDEGMSAAGVVKLEDAFTGSRAERAAVRGMLQAMEDLSGGPLAESFKAWVKTNAPLAYKEGRENGRVFVEAMNSETGPPYGVGHEYLHWRWTKQDAEALKATVTQAYKFANQIPAESAEYYREIMARAVGERWSRKQLIQTLVRDGELTSLTDSAGREISVQRRAAMFADWHLNDTVNMAQKTHDTLAFGEDPPMIWDAVIDSHTSEITLERVGKIQKRSEWEAAGGNVFDGSGIPPLWPGCRCKLRAVDKTWFSEDEWTQATGGESMLTGQDLELYNRRKAELAAKAA